MMQSFQNLVLHYVAEVEVRYTPENKISVCLHLINNKENHCSTLNELKFTASLRRNYYSSRHFEAFSFLVVPKVKAKVSLSDLHVGCQESNTFSNDLYRMT